MELRKAGVLEWGCNETVVAAAAHREQWPVVMITMDFGISPGCYQVGGVKTLNYSGNSVVR